MRSIGQYLAHLIGLTPSELRKVDTAADAAKHKLRPDWTAEYLRRELESRR